MRMSCAVLGESMTAVSTILYETDYWETALLKSCNFSSMFFSYVLISYFQVLV